MARVNGTCKRRVENTFRRRDGKTFAPRHREKRRFRFFFATALQFTVCSWNFHPSTERIVVPRRYGFFYSSLRGRLASTTRKPTYPCRSILFTTQRCTLGSKRTKKILFTFQRILHRSLRILSIRDYYRQISSNSVNRYSNCFQRCQKSTISRIRRSKFRAFDILRRLENDLFQPRFAVSITVRFFGIGLFVSLAGCLVNGQSVRLLARMRGRSLTNPNSNFTNKCRL